MLRQLRLALQAATHLLEAARDDLAAMGERLDRLTVASRQCRLAVLQQQNQKAAAAQQAELVLAPK